MDRFRITVAPEWIALAVAVFFAAACNGRFWRELLDGRGLGSPAGLAFAAATFLLLVGVHFLLLVPFSFRYVLRPLVTALLVVTAAVTYYMHEYNVYFDSSMMRNVFQTNGRESAELLDWGMIPHFLLYAALPAALVWFVRLRAERPVPGLLRRAGLGLACLAVVAATAFGFAGDYASFFRARREARYLITPFNVLSASVRVAITAQSAAAGPRIPVGADAVRGPGWRTRTKPVLFVFAVGETARAASFGLDGYERDTTPRLRAAEVVNFPRVQACGTATADALPCMFSRFERAQYDDDKGRRYESLLDVVQRAGFRTVWIDNNTGCKGICAGVEYVPLDPSIPACAGGDCLDLALLETSRGLLDGPDRNLFLVLHQRGQHGPAYFRRYPAEFEKFTPVCRSEDLHDCSVEQIRNAYDNALLYTDHVLVETIEWLKSVADRYDTALLYVSDHGESLGENGLFLHGLPYRIAPDVQKHVPMVTWISPGFADSFGLDLGALTAGAGENYSHDNLFHSVLGLLEIETSAYERRLDLFATTGASRGEVDARAR